MRQYKYYEYHGTNKNSVRNLFSAHSSIYDLRTAIVFIYNLSNQFNVKAAMSVRMLIAKNIRETSIRTFGARNLHNITIHVVYKVHAFFCHTFYIRHK